MASLFEEYFNFKNQENTRKFAKFKKDKLMVLDKEDVIEEGIFKFGRLKKSGFCTFYTGLSFWNIKSDYFEESRKASRRVKEFIRLFIIRDISDLDNQHLLIQIKEDIAAKTQVYVCLYDRINEFDLKKDFGVWDENYVCIVQYDSNNSVTGITVSGKKKDIDKAHEWKDKLIRLSTKICTLDDLERFRISNSTVKITQSDRYKEFQLKSIELQMSISNKECQGSYIDENSCHWYHSSWPILRALNIVSTPNWHNNFYIDGISNYLSRNHRKPNILVVATADATILEHLESGLGNLVYANIWVIDLCPTPLEVARLYAKLRNIRIHTVQMNALNLIEEGLRPEFFDLVMTDAFITRFSDQKEKEMVISQWNKILIPGGEVITTCRISGEKKEVGSQKEVNDFVSKTESVFRKYSEDNPRILSYINNDLTLLKAREYARNITSNPIDASVLKKFFLDNGFVISNQDDTGNFQTKSVGGEFKPTIYAQIIARKVSFV